MNLLGTINFRDIGAGTWYVETVEGVRYSLVGVHLTDPDTIARLRSLDGQQVNLDVEVISDVAVVGGTSLATARLIKVN